MPLTDVHNTLAMAAKPPQVHTDAAVSMAMCCRLSWAPQAEWCIPGQEAASTAPSMATDRAQAPSAAA